VGLAHSRGTQEQDVLALAEVPSGGQLIDLLAADRGVELPVEVLKRFEGPEVGGFGSPLQVALLPDIEFILEDQLQELLMTKSVGGGFLKPDIQALGQAREA